MIGARLKNTLITMWTATVLVMPFCAVVEVQAAENKIFSDVYGGDWYHEAVSDLHNEGLIEGYGDGTFRPDQIITKGEFIKLLMMTLGYPKEMPGTSHWASVYADKAKVVGLLGENEFTDEELDEGISRSEMAAIADRAEAVAVIGRLSRSLQADIV